MKELEEIANRRKELERVAAFRRLRLSRRREDLRRELSARITPSGIIARHPLITFGILFGIGFIFGKVIVSAIPTPKNKTNFISVEERSGERKPMLIGVFLKDVAKEFLTNFFLNKMRQILTSRLNQFQSTTFSTASASEKKTTSNLGSTSSQHK